MYDIIYRYNVKSLAVIAVLTNLYCNSIIAASFLILTARPLPSSLIVFS